MAPAPRPTLVLLAGPNGAGKSTLFETRIAPQLQVPFINADVIQREELAPDDMTAAYQAAEIATERRERLFAKRKSFATETVFSHVSKLELVSHAIELGYRVILFHISLGHPDLSVARVTERVKEGGHPVPETKIRARFDRNGPLIRQAVLMSDVGHVFDNSKLNTPPERVLSFRAGKLTFALPELPDWAYQLYAEDLTLEP